MKKFMMVRVNGEDYERLRSLANQEYRSITNQLRLILKLFYEAVEEEAELHEEQEEAQ